MRGRRKYTYTVSRSDTEYPHVYPVFNGWHAAGDGWAASGATKEEAIEKYHKAAQRRAELLEK